MGKQRGLDLGAEPLKSWSLSTVLAITIQWSVSRDPRSLHLSSVDARKWNGLHVFWIEFVLGHTQLGETLMTGMELGDLRGAQVRQRDSRGLARWFAGWLWGSPCMAAFETLSSITVKEQIQVHVSV